MVIPYTPNIERFMQLHHRRLPEKERRHYAAIEALKVGFGRKIYISKLFQINRRTLNKGLAELRHPTLFEQIPIGKQRRIGGGRKKNWFFRLYSGVRC